jgi:hypothetical protein
MFQPYLDAIGETKKDPNRAPIEHRELTRPILLGVSSFKEKEKN